MGLPGLRVPADFCYFKEGNQAMEHFAMPFGGRLTRYPAAGAAVKPALILCPGGGYEHCSIREGAPVARAFARLGVESFVLEYDCEKPPLGLRPLAALSGAVAWARQNAGRLGINQACIAVGGFSAGAHLAALHGAVWDRADRYPADTDLALHKPNALVLGYPVVTAGEAGHRGCFDRLAPRERQADFSVETLVTPAMPPAFLWHTLDDATVPVENTLLLEAALRAAGISHEVHLFPHGTHGLALADLETADPQKGRLPDRHVGRWLALAAEWLKEQR